MLRSMFAKTLRDQRRAFLWWGIGLFALAAYLIAFFPALEQSGQELQQFINQMPPALKALVGEESSFATPEGYLNTELFFTGPLLFLIYTIGVGTAAIAGEEEAGTLDILLVNPIPRWRVVIEKLLAMTVGTLFLALLFWLGLVAGALIADVRIGMAPMAALVFSMALLGIVYGCLALMLGAVTGNKGLAMAVPAVLGVVGYLVNTLAPMIGWMKPYQKLSPFYYALASDPLRNGLRAGDLGVLIGLAAILLLAGLLGFARRDLNV